MAVPWAYWPSGTVPPSTPAAPQHPPAQPMMMMHPMMMSGYPGGVGGFGYGIPSIPPSSNPFIVDPEGAIRDFTEHATNADRHRLCDVWDLQCLEDWGKDESHRNVIMTVLKSRLDLPWPYNYKALDVLAVMPLSEAVSVADKLKSLSETPASVEGAAEIKKSVKPLLAKVEAEKQRLEEEDMKKKHEAISAMWGGLWANDHARPPGALAAAGWHGWQYPYQVVPGVPAQAHVGWASNAPKGWSPASITPIPQIYPFSRTGYYSLLPPGSAPPDPPERNATEYTITISPTGQKAPPVLCSVFCFLVFLASVRRLSIKNTTRAVALGLDQLERIWESQRLARGW